VQHASVMTLELLRHVQTAYPFWNRTGGRDHVWLFAHDEGACWAPAEVYRRSIILTHWGRADANHTSNTAFPGDNYSRRWADAAHPALAGPEGWGAIVGGHPCYKPGKVRRRRGARSDGAAEAGPREHGCGRTHHERATHTRTHTRIYTQSLSNNTTGTRAARIPDRRARPPSLHFLIRPRTW
jgi:hypothetical protein